MKLSTRLIAAMVTLVLGTAAAGVLGYRSVESAVVPVSLDRLQTQARARLGILDIYLRGVRGDVLSLRAIPAHDGLMRAVEGGGHDAEENTPKAKWRARVEGIYAGQLRAKPAIQQVRLIGAADDGRELVRVDRSGPNGAIRVVSQADLQTKGDRGYFREAIALPPGEVYVSPIELNQEYGVLEVPHMPVVRVATAVADAAGKPFGVVIINLDIRPIFDAIRAAMDEDSLIYIVNEAGDFLLHPDPARAFGFDLGTRHRWEEELPRLASAAGVAGRGGAVVETVGGEKVAAALVTMRLADALRIGIIETESYASIMAPATSLRRSDLVVALLAIGIATLLAVVMARSLTRPLRQMTAAVEGFGRGEPMHVPTDVNGEVGILARAFIRMAAEVTAKTDELHNKSEVLDKTIESMADGFLIIDAEGRTLFANATCRAMFGDDPQIGSDDWQAHYLRFRPDGVTPMPVHETPIGRALRGESFDNVEIAYRRVDDTKLIQLAASGRILAGEFGKMEGAVIVYRNLTAFKETERQLHQAQKMEAVGQLTGGIAHDFNNILTVITGAVEIIADGVNDRPELHMVAKMIDEAVDRGADLTHQLLSFARKQPLEPREISVNAMVQDAARLLRPTLGEQVQIEARLAADPWPAMADPAQLSSALLNLAVNARDAMPSGGKLTLETANVVLDEAYAAQHSEVNAGPYAMIAVSDTGQGIPAAIRDRVFDPFFTTKAIGKGTGLGLSMVYGFVKQSGGHIKIYSEEGYGTTIKIYLPRAEGSGVVAQPVVAPAIVGGHEVLLVVEDDELVRKYVITNLASLGYEVHMASTAQEALALVGDGLPFDLLFTDVVLGAGMNGRQLADEVRKQRPDLKVLYTSGYTENAIVHHGRLDAGIHLLTKPYRRADLARALRLALDVEEMAGGEVRSGPTHSVVIPAKAGIHNHDS
jgi:signal transduction histidine kinase/CheY-like chemotaxis protein/HAMP domain-containing protein